MKASSVQWIVTFEGELGVKIDNQIFTLYKGESLPILNGKYRLVEKREFGEVCFAPNIPRNGNFNTPTDADISNWAKQYDWIDI